MEPFSEVNDTMVIYSSKLEFYQDKKRKLDLKIESLNNEKRKIEENINKELPTLMDKAKEKRKASERDQVDLQLLKDQVKALTSLPNNQEEVKEGGQKKKVKIGKTQTKKEIKDEPKMLPTTSSESKTKPEIPNEAKKDDKMMKMMEILD